MRNMEAIRQDRIIHVLVSAKSLALYTFKPLVSHNCTGWRSRMLWTSRAERRRA